MADLRINFAGIKSPNPFWLASAPPTNSGAQIHRAFEAGWGGAVWKTIGAPVLNVSNRYGAWHYGRQRMLAINNVELISDRPIEINLREIAEVKRAWPDRAVIVSAMVDSKPEAWREIVEPLPPLLGRGRLGRTAMNRDGRKKSTLGSIPHVAGGAIGKLIGVIHRMRIAKLPKVGSPGAVC